MVGVSDLREPRVTFNMTTTPFAEPVEENPERSLRTLPGFLAAGFRLGLRNWPCVVWVYVVTLVFALLTAVPVNYGLSPYLDHSLEAEKIGGTLDFASLAELGVHLNADGFFPVVLRNARWLQTLELLVLFVLFAGSVWLFVSGEAPRLPALVRGGLTYFWRFVRAALIAGFVTVVIAGGLLAIREMLLDRLDAVVVERPLFFWALISGAVVVFAALLVRLWWDLVEIYIVRIVRNAARSVSPGVLDGQPKIHPVRQALMPALRLLRHHFWLLGGSFFLSGLAGICAFGVCVYFWKLLPAHQVFLAAFLGQLGLFSLLAARFWQRGVETVLVMSEAQPRIVDKTPVLEAASVHEAALPVRTEELEHLEQRQQRQEVEEILASADTGNLASSSEPILREAPDFAEPEPDAPQPAFNRMPEPTLRDLVLKLRNQPWAKTEEVPEIPLEPTPAAPAPTVADPVTEPYTALLERHNAKLPLGAKPGPAKEEPTNQPGKDTGKDFDRKEP
jgi:hypothetical protein